MPDDAQPPPFTHWLKTWRGARPLDIAAALLWAAAAGVLLYRLPYGVSHRDEAFYSAMPYSFLLGNRPYFDELALHQNAGLLLVPFFRVYLAIVGSADGIIMFNRHLYFAYLAICSIVAYRLSRRLSGHVPACCAAALIILFAYYNLFALSYNTCGAFGFFCGIVCTAGALLKPRPGWQLFGASLWFLSGVFSYPGFAPALLVYVAIVLFWLYRQGQRESLVSGLCGLGAGALAFLAVGVPLLLWLGESGLQRLLAFSRSMGYAPSFFEKLNFFVHSGIWFWRWDLLGFAAVFVGLPLACRRGGRLLWLLGPLAAMALGLCYLESLRLPVTTSAAVCLTALPILAPVCVALNRRWRYGRFVLGLVWAPSVLSMLCASYSSANGYLAASLGSLGASLAGLLSLHAYLECRSERSPEERWSLGVVFGAVVCSLCFIQGHSLFAGCYDVATTFAGHDTRVRSGPLRGVMATRSEAAFDESIDRDLKSVESGAKTLTIFDGFATGYLSTRLQPRTFTQWIVWAIDASYASAISAQTFGTPDKLPDLMLAITVVDSARPFWEPYFKDRYAPVIQRPEFGYAILRRLPEPRKVRHARQR
ncbi:MAG TPA: hypothetical protein VHW01_17250 [Polyangiaceae bacterium]|nr:hypothetical protein [Polyangiaceae bacterium]